MKTYEIYNLTTEEILVDNLSFAEVPELFEAYANFYNNDEIVVCYRENSVYVRPYKPRQNTYRNFLTEWTELVDELTLLGNLY